MHDKKTWNGRSDIDAGLPDEWLASVNSLHCWEVRSTCEGHPAPIKNVEDDHARIALSVRPQYLEMMLHLIEVSPDDLRQSLAEAFGQTESRYSLRGQCAGQQWLIENEPRPTAPHTSPSPTDPVANCIESFFQDDKLCVLNVHHKETRRSETMPSSASSWLNHIAEGLARFDNECRMMMEEGSANKA